MIELGVAPAQSVSVGAANDGAIGISRGWWNLDGALSKSTPPLFVYQPKGAADYATSLLDLGGNRNHASEGSAPSWNAITGWTFNGSSQYLNTGVTPVNSSQDYTFIVRFANRGAGNYKFIYGVQCPETTTRRPTVKRNWWASVDSNHRPYAYQAYALNHLS